MNYQLKTLIELKEICKKRNNTKLSNYKNQLKKLIHNNYINN